MCCECKVLLKSNYNFVSRGITIDGLARYFIRYIRLVAMVAIISVMVTGATAQNLQASQVHTGSISDIYGDQRFKDNIQASLDYLKTNYPADYNNVTFWLAEIRPTDTYTRVNNYGTCYINGPDADASFYWLASVLIHEAQHVQDDDTYFIDNAYSDQESEHRALISQAIYLKSVSNWTQEQTDSWIDGWLQKKYWETIPKKYE